MCWYLRDNISETITDECMKFGKCTCLESLFDVTYEWVVLNELQNLAGPVYSYNYAIAWDTVKSLFITRNFKRITDFFTPGGLADIARPRVIVKVNHSESHHSKSNPDHTPTNHTPMTLQPITPRPHSSQSHPGHTPADHTPSTFQPITLRSHSSQSHPDPWPVTPSST